MTPGALFLFDNYADNAILTASSQQTTMPVDQLYDQLRKKFWQSLAGYSAWLKAELLYLNPVSYVALIDSNLTATGEIRLEAWSAAVGSANQLPNPDYTAGIAGTPGTLPTSVTSSGSINAVTQTLAFGEDGGLPYMDLTLAGTPSSTFTWQLFLASGSAINAVLNDAMLMRGKVKLVAGSMTNVLTLKLRFAEHDAGGSSLGTTHDSADLKASVTATTAELTHSSAMTNASCGHARPIVNINLTSGLAVNFTIRFYPFFVGNDGQSNTKLLDMTVTPSLYTNPLQSALAYGQGNFGAGPFGAVDDYATMNDKNVTLVRISPAINSQFWRVTLTDGATAYQRLGKLFIGRELTPTYSFTYGWEKQRIDNSTVLESQGKQRYINPRDSQVDMSGSLDYLSEAEWTAMDQQLQRFMTWKSLVFSVYPENTDKGRATTVYGSIRSASMQHGNRLFYSHKVRVVEDL